MKLKRPEVIRIKKGQSYPRHVPPKEGDAEFHVARVTAEEDGYHLTYNNTLCFISDSQLAVAKSLVERKKEKKVK